MPNWAQNFVEISHEDPCKIHELAAAMKAGEFLNHVIPVPEELKNTLAGSYGDPEKQEQLEEKTKANIEKYGYGNWYDFCNGRWGTKWDVDCQGGVEVTNDGKTVAATFDSAWAPPLGVYQQLVEDGYSVRAYYYESGMAFAGIWDDGIDDWYQDWGDSQGARDMLPQELDDFFAISESMAEWEAEDEEDLTRWIKGGVDNQNATELVDLASS